MIRLKEVVMAAKKVYGFEKPPKPIPASDIKKTITSDVVVVGGGIAGPVAALSAAGYRKSWGLKLTGTIGSVSSHLSASQPCILRAQSQRHRAIHSGLLPSQG
jgi:hypothetical protein